MRVTSESGYYPVVGIGAITGLAQATGDRKLAKSQGKVKKGKRKCNPSPYKGGTAMNLEDAMKVAQSPLHRDLSLIRRS